MSYKRITKERAFKKMKTAIIVFIVIMNLASIIVIFKSLSNIELKNKIILVVIGEIVMYVILFIV